MPNVARGYRNNAADAYELGCDRCSKLISSSRSHVRIQNTVVKRPERGRLFTGMMCFRNNERLKRGIGLNIIIE